jgi:hypothetical protein
VKGLRLLAVAAMLSVACFQSPTEPAGVPLGQPFDLRAGSSVVVSGGLKVTFDRVVADSRCPMDAICIWAGEAVLALKLAQGTAAPVEREVRVDSASPMTSFGAYTIKATALTPYPRSGLKPEPTDFVVTLTIAR